MHRLFARPIALLLGTALAGSALASLSTYSQDFEGLTLSDTSALTNDGWLVYGNVFDASHNYIYGYGPFPAPNNGGGFSQIATGEQGAGQGAQYLNTFSDYNNGDHGNNRWIESNVFQEQVVGAGDLGQTYNFLFDYKASSGFGPGGGTTARAFIKVLDPGTGYSLVAFPNFETTQASTTDWNSSSLSITIDGAWTGHILQFGFMNYATNYQPSGVYYDNLSFAPVPEPATVTVLAASLVGLLRRRRR